MANLLNKKIKISELPKKSEKKGKKKANWIERLLLKLKK
jgi:hypothetical protein